MPCSNGAKFLAEHYADIWQLLPQLNSTNDNPGSQFSLQQYMIRLIDGLARDCSNSSALMELL